MIDPTPTFKALSDPTRQAILILLGDRPQTIAEVADNFDMTRAGVRKHLDVLEKGRLITAEPRGRERINTLRPDGFELARDWVSIFETFWDDRIAALKTAVENEKGD